MKKLLIIPISILLLTACVTVQAPSPAVEEQKQPQEELKVETPVQPVVETSKVETPVAQVEADEQNEEKTSDGWIKSSNSDRVVSYSGKEITLKGKVVERESYGEWKYFFSVSGDSLDNLPSELVEKIIKKDYLSSFILYFEGKDVTDNYKNQEITVTPKSIGVLSEGYPHFQLKTLP
ncbi:hypothetical protein CO044_01030 [Candidatus Peregrinibacteria bacterium CG_4_9_14_0_2_um_filter_38_9]|nr:MAG: hypothetical protein CO044_01030 [Candidatus Peregrinibacteria bacterium CG_4_9_14_0_2_um_filter_38_9]